MQFEGTVGRVPASSHGSLRRSHGLASAGWALLLIASISTSAWAAPGDLTTIAGGPGWGPARDLAFSALGVVATSDTVYFVDDGWGLVRRVDLSTGQMTIFAGGGEPADGVGDGGPGTSAALRDPWGLHLDGDRALYIAIYDRGGARLIFERETPPSTGWSTGSGRGYRLRLPRPALDGIDGIDLFYGTNAQAKIDVSGLGPGLRLPSVSEIEAPLVVQLVVGPLPALACWEAVYDRIETRGTRLLATR